MINNIINLNLDNVLNISVTRYKNQLHNYLIYHWSYCNFISFKLLNHWACDIYAAISGTLVHLIYIISIHGLDLRISILLWPSMILRLLVFNSYFKVYFRSINLTVDIRKLLNVAFLSLEKSLILILINIL